MTVEYVPTAAQDFGTTLMTPAQIAASQARTSRRLDEMPPAPELEDVEKYERPELDVHSLALELGARSLLGVPGDAPAPLVIDRLDPDGHTILFGDGGAGKGTLASSWAVACVNSGMRVLIVDYENHPAEWSRRIYGYGGDEARERVTHVAPLAPAWTLQRGPIWEQAKHLRTLAGAVKADILIIDSIVMACAGSDPMDPATATAYSAALELIERPVLSLAHTTKAGDTRYPFGSVFWHNLARTTWSLKRDGDNAILSHRKHNNYTSQGRYVVTVTWRDDLPRELWEQPYSAVLSDRIAELLAEAAMSAEQLVDRLNGDDDDTEPVKADSVRKALKRGIPDRFRLVDGKYRLATR